MREIAALRSKNGLTVISTFSGCGGSCLGLEMAGFDIRAASEFVTAARETYAANHPGVPISGLDIRETSGDSLLQLAGLTEVDVLEGSPPCASFSTAGKRQGKWGKVSTYSDTKQRSDDLFFEFARLLGEIRPRAFIAENVSGLAKGAAKGYFKEILAALKSKGYRVEARLLDASMLGVPQSRKRIFFVGIRDDLERDPVFPKPLGETFSIADACPWLAEQDLAARIKSGKIRQFVAEGPHPTVTTVAHDTGVDHCGRSHPETVDPIESEFIPVPPSMAAKWMTLRLGESHKKHFSLVRSHPRRPAPTIQASHGQPGIYQTMPPFSPRKFTILELKRLCSFPDDFVLTGSFAQRWERLGRAVPPLMMRAVAECVAFVLGGLDGR